MAVTIKSPDYRPISLGAEEITENNVQYWCRHTKELKCQSRIKALKLLKFNCIRYVGKFNNPIFDIIRNKYEGAKHFFICLPLNTSKEHKALGVSFQKEPYPIDYNSSEYLIFAKANGTFECNCQGYQSKKRKGELIEGGANCSHILALFYNFKLKRFGK